MTLATHRQERGVQTCTCVEYMCVSVCMQAPCTYVYVCVDVCRAHVSAFCVCIHRRVQWRRGELVPQIQILCSLEQRILT